jgi:hypothetical protein
MKKTMPLRAALCAPALALLAGCMSDKQWEDTRIMHSNYMAQARTYDAVAARGTNMTITITGAYELVLQAPLNPLTTIPQAPDVLHDAIDGVKTVAGYAALGYVGAKAVDGLGDAKTTVINNAAE